MNEILTTTKFVADNSASVRINYDKVVAFAANFDRQKTQHWLMLAPFDFNSLDERQKLHFLFVFNALSFSYWGEPKWTIEYENKCFDGAWGMIAALGRAIKEGYPILDFNKCADISENDFKQILRGNVQIPLFQERMNILKDISSVMVSRYQGEVSNLLKEAAGDAQNLLEIILRDFPSFRDEAIYKGQTVFFQKRVQLLVADIYQMFDGMGVGALRRIDEITACADYKLPQLLRKVGIFEYVPALAEKIDSKIELPSGSEEEVEIRANTVLAIELIKDEIRKTEPKITSNEINDQIWLATQEKFPDDKPYHRTRTIAY